MPIPLTSLPVTTALLECNRAIVAADRRFVRLSAMERSNRPAQTLTDIIAQTYWPAAQVEGRSMFEPLVNEAASLFNVPATSVSALTRALVLLMTNERTGGPDGFLDLFRRVGLGDVIASSRGGNGSPPILRPHLEKALGSSTLENLAKSSGLTQETATWLLTFLLPKLIRQFTPNGEFLSPAVEWWRREGMHEFERIARTNPR